MPDTTLPSIVTQDSGIDETIIPIEEQRPGQDKSCDQSQFTDSGFGDDATMSLTQNESTTSQLRPSDILITSEWVPDDLRLNSENHVEVTVAQQARPLQRQAESEAMKKRVSTARVWDRISITANMVFAG